MPTVRALHLLPHQGVGGAQRFVIELVRHERMDQASDELILTERALDVDTDFLAPATPVHFLGLLGEKTDVRARRLTDLAESRSARALVVYRSSDLPLALAAKRLSKGSLRVITHLFDPPGAAAPEPAGPFAGLFAGLSAGLLGRRPMDVGAVDEFHVASPALLEPWKAQGAAATLRAAAVDTQRFYPQEGTSSTWRSAHLPLRDTLLVGSLMRAERGKDHDVLIHAIEQRHAAGRPTALMLVGDGPLLPALRERAKGSKTLFVRRRVLDSPGFFSRIDAFALHSASELVPMALLEALACGRAATVADPGGVADLVGDDAALLTPPGDVDAVIRALDQLADPDVRRQLGEAGRQRAVEHHNLGRLRPALVASYS